MCEPNSFTSNFGNQSGREWVPGQSRERDATVTETLPDGDATFVASDNSSTASMSELQLGINNLTISSDLATADLIQEANGAYRFDRNVRNLARGGVASLSEVGSAEYMPEAPIVRTTASASPPPVSNTACPELVKGLPTLPQRCSWPADGFSYAFLDLACSVMVDLAGSHQACTCPTHDNHLMEGLQPLNTDLSRMCAIMKQEFNMMAYERNMLRAEWADNRARIS